MQPVCYLPRPVPAALTGLVALALDLRWSWNHRADQLWQRVDAELWETTGDPWLILESVPRRRLEALGDAPEVCHLNEGHAAFAVLERARAFMRRNDGASVSPSAPRGLAICSPPTPRR